MTLGRFGGSAPHAVRVAGGGSPSSGDLMEEAKTQLIPSPQAGNPAAEDQTNFETLRINLSKADLATLPTAVKLGIDTGGESTASGHIMLRGEASAPSVSTAGTIGINQGRSNNAALQSGDVIGVLKFLGADSVVINNPSVWIVARVDAAVSSGLVPGRLEFHTIASGASPVERMRIDRNGNIIINTAAIATTATDGFLYIPTCAGTPTGTPTAYTGRVPMVYDTTNQRLYVYNGAWVSVLFA